MCRPCCRVYFGRPCADLVVGYSADIVVEYSADIVVEYCGDLVVEYCADLVVEYCADLVVGVILTDLVVEYCADLVAQFILADYFFAPIDESPAIVVRRPYNPPCTRQIPLCAMFCEIVPLILIGKWVG